MCVQYTILLLIYNNARFIFVNRRKNAHICCVRVNVTCPYLRILFPPNILESLHFLAFSHYPARETIDKLDSTLKI